MSRSLALSLTVAACALLSACGDTAPAPATPDGAKGATPDASAPQGPASPTAPAPSEELVDTLPAGEDGLRTFLQAILADPEGRAALSATLRPAHADFVALIKGEAAARAEAVYAPGWDGGALVLDPGEEARTEIRITPTTTDEIAAWTGTAAAEFPGGWRKAGAHLEPGHTIYRAEFLEPGRDAGMSFDGFVHINGHWCIFPKLWRFLGE
jgi:hypothetical protein